MLNRIRRTKRLQTSQRKETKRRTTRLQTDLRKKKRNLVVERVLKLLNRPTEIHQAYRTGMASDIRTIEKKVGRLRDSTLTKSIFVKDAERRLGAYFEKSIDLKEWSRKHFTKKPTLDGIKKAADELIGKNIVYDGKIVIMLIWKSSNESQLFVQIAGYDLKVACFFATFDLYEQEANLDSLTPYKKTCPDVIPKSCFDIYELLGHGLGTMRLTLTDGARTNLCSSERLTRYDQNAKYEVMLSALTAIKTGKTYYERYGFTPIDEDAMDEFNSEMKKDYKKDNMYSGDFLTYGDFLKTCVRLMNDAKEKEACHQIPDEIKSDISSKINRLKLPDKFEKWTGILEHDQRI